MAHRIAWSTRALQDVESIGSYIAEDSPAYARTVVRAIVNQTKVLAKFPRAGRKVPEFDDENIREVFAYSYRIVYRLEGDEIAVTAVIHGKRTLPSA
jgi:toxin ParE1/3/4